MTSDETFLYSEESPKWRLERKMNQINPGIFLVYIPDRSLPDRYPCDLHGVKVQILGFWVFRRHSSWINSPRKTKLVSRKLYPQRKCIITLDFQTQFCGDWHVYYKRIIAKNKFYLYSWYNV